MKEISVKKADNKVILKLSGHIDSKNANEYQEEILKLLKKNNYDEVNIDANDLNYISSAGLRIILKLKNENKLTKIFNVGSEIYEIFDMTGFTDMLEINKKYREISVDNAIVIGEGANGIVYKIDDETIVKVYKNNDAMEEIKKEREFAKRAFVLGIPTAISYDIVRVGDKFGTVFELLNADSFSRLIIKNPNKIDDYIKQMTMILKKIHSIHVKDGEFSSDKEYYLEQIDMIKNDLDEDLINKLIKLIKGIKDTGTLVHGDYHTKNIMMQNDEPLLIDMDTLSIGNPIFEFASMYLAFQGFSRIDKDNIKNFLGISYETGVYIYDNILKLYFENKTEAELEVIKEKIKVVAFIRLLRRTIHKTINKTDDDLLMIELTKKDLKELLSKYDDLNIL